MRLRAPLGLRSASLAALLLASAAPAAATLLVYEPFDYAADTVLDAQAATGQNLVGNYLGGASPPQLLQVASPGLDYGNLSGPPAPSANRLSQASGGTAGTATVGVGDEVPVSAGSTIFWSALMTLDDSANGNHFASATFRDTATGDEITFGEPVVGMGGLRLSVSTAATGGLVADSADNAFIDGHSVLLVGRYSNSADPGGDRLDLLVYDTADPDDLRGFDLLDPNAEFAFSIEGLDVDLVRIDQITFTIRGTANNFIDELRIGTSYASVVPEPASGVLLLMGIGGLAVAGRRRRPARG